ncbi:ankyrin repeat domain-containing protein 63-like [Anguilla rostrata]|uniref:ankyrin repeat domain-containing protein 63-like n=1 Tax=Anguilla rostrata TaxID=7938 RepID=UPI0030D29DAD
MLRLPEKGSGQTGSKILLEAMSKDKVHLARFILDALDGKIIDSTSEGAATPLITSVLLPDSQARSKFMNLLLQRGASVNRQDERGRTALSYACEKGYLDAVKVLVQNNADPEVVDSWGNTALMYASVAGHSAVVDFLVRAFKRLGLQIDRQNKVGNSAVEVAKYLGHKDCLFALTSKTKKSHDDALRDFDSNEGESSRGKKPTHASEVNDTQSQSHFCPKGVDAARTGEDSIAASSSRRESSFLRSRIQSMDSIEEFERECDAALSWPGDLSGVPVQKPHARSYHGQNNNRTFKLGENNRRYNVAPLSRPTDNQFPLLFSPRPAKNALNRRASACTGASAAGPSNSPLGVLLTPIPGSKGGKPETESETQKKNAMDFGIRLFHDSYYQKRSSLPTSVLRPAPPARALMPSRKTKTVQEDTLLGSTATPAVTAAGAPTSFAVLGNKLLRRFTFPELKKSTKDVSGDGSGGTHSGSPEVTEPGMPKSESYPLATRHSPVGSKPSIDSISAVKCEFDFHFKLSPS